MTTYEGNILLSKQALLEIRSLILSNNPKDEEAKLEMVSKIDEVIKELDESFEDDDFDEENEDWED